MFTLQIQHRGLRNPDCGELSELEAAFLSEPGRQNQMVWSFRTTTEPDGLERSGTDQQNQMVWSFRTGPTEPDGLMGQEQINWTRWSKGSVKWVSGQFYKLTSKFWIIIILTFVRRHKNYELLLLSSSSSSSLSSSSSSSSNWSHSNWPVYIYDICFWYSDLSWPRVSVTVYIYYCYY